MDSRLRGNDDWVGGGICGRGLVSANGAGIAARCQSKGTDKVAVQMALIGKARGTCDIGKGIAGFDHGPCKINAPLDQIGVRGEARRMGKVAQRLKFA